MVDPEMGKGQMLDGELCVIALPKRHFWGSASLRSWALLDFLTGTIFLNPTPPYQEPLSISYDRQFQK